MGGSSSPPPVQQVKTPPPPPQLASTAVQTARANQANDGVKDLGAGNAGTILTSAMGVDPSQLGPSSLAGKKLLGQ